MRRRIFRFDPRSKMWSRRFAAHRCGDSRYAIARRSSLTRFFDPLSLSFSFSLDSFANRTCALRISLFFVHSIGESDVVKVSFYSRICGNDNTRRSRAGVSLVYRADRRWSRSTETPRDVKVSREKPTKTEFKTRRSLAHRCAQMERKKIIALSSTRSDLIPRADCDKRGCPVLQAGRNITCPIVIYVYMRSSHDYIILALQFVLLA